MKKLILSFALVFAVCTTSSVMAQDTKKESGCQKTECCKSTDKKCEKADCNKKNCKTEKEADKKCCKKEASTQSCGKK